MPRPSAAELAAAPLYRMILGEDPLTGAAHLSEPLRALHAEDGVWTSQQERVAPDEFASGALRCDEEGNPLVAAGAPLPVQAHVLCERVKQGAGGLDGHLEDLRRIRATLPDDPQLVEDANERGELWMYDAIVSDLRDRMPEPRPEESDTPDAVIRRIEMDTGIAPENWARISDLPSYQVEQFRAMARMMLSPVLGNVAALEDLRILLLPRQEAERIGALRRWFRNAPDSRTLQPFENPAMRGYRTTEPVLAERNGVAMLCYGDFMAEYALAWQSDPEVAPEVAPDEDDDPAPYRF